MVLKGNGNRAMETPEIMTANDIIRQHGLQDAFIKPCLLQMEAETHKRYAKQQEELQRQGFSRFLKFVIKEK